MLKLVLKFSQLKQAFSGNLQMEPICPSLKIKQGL